MIPREGWRWIAYLIRLCTPFSLEVMFAAVVVVKFLNWLFVNVGEAKDLGVCL